MSSAVDTSYKSQMSKLQAIRSPKHKSFIEFLKGELRRARTSLADQTKRARYDEELLEERRDQLMMILDVALADGMLSPVEEERIHSVAGDVADSDEDPLVVLEMDRGVVAADTDHRLEITYDFKIAPLLVGRNHAAMNPRRDVQICLQLMAIVVEGSPIRGSWFHDGSGLCHEFVPDTLGAVFDARHGHGFNPLLRGSYDTRVVRLSKR